ncbi:hypothetical protein GCM10020366_62910 [Saccharopolyspora gregorii]|uniref:Uncharacterized protein n=1 Tax=Saccharopolyspora gregorii TaxID=33914 RepID=A0ABP6S0Q1_9PSEU
MVGIVAELCAVPDCCRLVLGAVKLGAVEFGGGEFGRARTIGSFVLEWNGSRDALDSIAVSAGGARVELGGRGAAGQLACWKATTGSWPSSQLTPMRGVPSWVTSEQS